MKGTRLNLRLGRTQTVLLRSYKMAARDDVLLCLLYSIEIEAALVLSSPDKPRTGRFANMPAGMQWQINGAMRLRSSSNTAYHRKGYTITRDQTAEHLQAPETRLKTSKQPLSLRLNMALGMRRIKCFESTKYFLRSHE